LTTSVGWDEILENDEQILWQGRPNEKFRIKLSQIATLVFGLFFAGFAVFWMVMAAGIGGIFWMFGLLHFAVGLSISFGPIYWDNVQRRNSWYSLSDQRAFIATDMPFRGRRIKSFPITASTVLDFRRSEPPSIYFAHEIRQGKNSSTRIDIGFEGIPDAAEVFALMRGLQKKISA